MVITHQTWEDTVPRLVWFTLFGVALRFLLLRLIPIAFWLIIIMAVLIMATTKAKAAPLDEDCGRAIAQVPHIVEAFADHARGPVYDATVTLPSADRSAAATTRYFITGDPHQPAPWYADDEIWFRFEGTGGVSYELRRSFSRPDGRAIEPAASLDVTEQLPAQLNTITVRVRDVLPPLAGASPIYLLMVGPALCPSVGAPTSAMVETRQGSATGDDEVTVPEATAPFSETATAAPRACSSACESGGDTAAVVTLVVATFALLVWLGTIARSRLEDIFAAYAVRWSERRS